LIRQWEIRHEYEQMKELLYALLFCLPIPRAGAQQQSDTLRTAGKDSAFVLENVYFETDRHQIKPASEAALARLYEFLVANPKVR